jgi:glucan biosynthesis protein C
MLLIPHHTAVSFSHIGNGYIYTDEVVDSLYYIIQSDFLNLWFMRLLFFISGISTFMALKKRSAIEYLKERFSKLFIPAAFVTLCLGPLTAYIVTYSEGHFIMDPIVKTNTNLLLI